MELLETMKIALRALARNKLRSALTMLGIIIGVGAVIAMVGIGDGAQKEVQNRIAAMGTNLLYVSAGSVNVGGTHLGAGATQTLVSSDVTAILSEAPAVANAAPVSSASTQLVFGNQNWATTVTGTEPQYFDIRDWAFSKGDTFSEDDVRRAANVAVIGETVRQNLFGNGNPVGQTIRAGNLPFTVVGVLTAKGTSGMGGDQDDGIYVPITTLQKKITGQDWLRNIMVSAKSQAESYAAQDQITAILRDRHRLRAGDPDDFSIRNLADIAELADQSAQVMTMLLASIAGVSLIVGGIGIMNIMLVSVTERTKEIGVRVAIGATEQDVQRQFLLESVVLSLLGGAIGIVVGIGSSILINYVLHWTVSVSALAIGAAVIFSTAIGIAFGYYPARKAARLDPIEALRFE
ncbi:MAG TPA: ABC transporter permease [Terriglobales bacterium]|nr:ABC transporter permease [Terriglobales bacterium]